MLLSTVPAAGAAGAIAYLVTPLTYNTATIRLWYDRRVERGLKRWVWSTSIQYTRHSRWWGVGVCNPQVGVASERSETSSPLAIPVCCVFCF